MSRFGAQEAELARDLARDEGVAEDARDEQYGASALEAPFSADAEPASAAQSYPDRAHAWEQYIAASKEHTASLVASTAAKQWPATGMFSTSPLTVSSSEDTTDVVVGRAHGAALHSTGGRSYAANAITRELLATNSSSPLHDTALEIERQKVLRDTADLVPSSPVARQSIASLASPLARAPGLPVTVALSAAPMAAKPSSPVQLFDSSVLLASAALPYSTPSNSELRVILESALRDAQLHRDRTILSDAMGDSSGVHRTPLTRHRRGGVYLPRAMPAQREADQQGPDYDQVQRDIDARLAAIRAERLIADQQRLVRRQHAGAVRLQAIARGWLVRRSAALAALRTARERIRRRKALQVSVEAERQRVERERLAAVLVDSRPEASRPSRAELGCGEAPLYNAEVQRRAAAREFEARLRAQLVEVQSAEAAARRLEADERLRDEELRRRRELDLRAAELSFVDDLRAAVAEDAARLEFAAAAQVAATERQLAFAAQIAAQERQAMAFEDALSREAERRALAQALELEERQRLVREQDAAKAAIAAEVQARMRDAAAAASAAAAAKPPLDGTGSATLAVLQVAQADAACAKALHALPAVPPLANDPQAVEPHAEDHPLELARAASVGGGRAVMLLRPGVPVGAVVDEATRPVSVQRPNAATAAARSLQALWRGYCARKDPSNPIVKRARARQRELVHGVTRLQAVCRGARVRTALRAALEAARFRDPDDFDYAPVDVGSFLGGLVPDDVDDYLSAERALASGPRAAWNDSPLPPAQQHQPHPQLLLASQGRGSIAFDTGGGGGRLARVRSHHTAADASALLPHGNAHASDASASRPPMGPSSHPVGASMSAAAAASALPPVRPRTGSGAAGAAASPALLPPPSSAHGLPQLLRPPLLLRPDTSGSASWELASVRTTDDEPAGRGAAQPPPPTPTAVGLARPPAMPRLDAAALLPLSHPPRQPPLPQPSPGSFVRGGHVGGAAPMKPQPPPAAPPADRRLAQLLRDPAALDLLLMQRRLRTQRAGEPLARGGGGGAAGGMQPVQSLLPQRQAPPDAVPREYRGPARVPASAAPGVAAATALRSSALQRALGFQAGLH